MLMDREALFFDDVLTSTADPIISEGYDLGAIGLLPGMGEMVRLFAQITVADAAGGTNIAMEVISATNGALTGTPTILYATPVVVTATLVVGYRFNIPALPVDNIAQQFIGLRAQTVGVFTGTAAITGGIITGDQNLQIGFPGVAAETGFNR